MLVQCNQCEQTVGTQSCVSGLTTIVPATLVVGLLLGTLGPTFVERDIGFGWVIAAAFGMWLIAGWFFDSIPRWSTRRQYCRRPCPSCGAQDWGAPHHTGFGL